METRIYNDLALHGALVMSKNESGFPENPQIGTMIIKDYCLYAYIKIGGMETWYPFANKTNSYVHTQGTESLTWIVQHNLGTTDVWVQVKDLTGNIIQVGKTDIDENSFQLNFTQATKGTAVVVAPDSIDVPDVKATLINVGAGAVVIDTSGVRVNGSYVLTSANISQQINDAVAVETSARVAAVDAEATARIASDSTLQASIAAEATARAAADTTLQAEIDLLSSGKADKATTLAGYGITDAISSTNNVLPLTSAKQVSGNVFFGSSTLEAAIDSFPTTESRSAKYFVEITRYLNSYSWYATDVQVVEVTVAHNGITAYLTEYGVTPYTSGLAVIDANIANGVLTLSARPLFKYTGIKFLRSSILI